MSFIELLKSSKIIKDCGKTFVETTKTLDINEKEKLKPEEVLRKNGFKIKLVIQTAFGIQIDFFRKPDTLDINNALKGFNFKIKNKSIFIMD